jgi:hypothetical protein
MENSCDPLLHGRGKVAVPIRAERNRSFSAPKGTGAAVSLSQSQSCLWFFLRIIPGIEGFYCICDMAHPSRWVLSQNSGM